MDNLEKQRVKDLIRKTKYMKRKDTGKGLTKKEMGECVKGYIALNKLTSGQPRQAKSADGTRRVWFAPFAPRAGRKNNAESEV